MSILLVSVIWCVAVLIGLHDVREHTASLTAELTKLGTAPAPSKVTTHPLNVTVSLPEFASGRVVADFNSVATDMHVPLDDVVYTLDRSEATFYQRYHITLTSQAGYSEIRKFVAALSSEMPNVSLDSIKCTRLDAATVTLNCELMFSAFFVKSSRDG